MKTKDVRQEFYNSITENIIDLINNENTLPWYKPWNNVKPNINSANYSTIPYNPVTGTIYRGVNYLSTKYNSRYDAQSDPRFLTFNNIKDCGFNLKKGSKAITIYFIAPKFGTKTTEKDKEVTEGKPNELQTKNYSFVYKKYKIFHASCIEGIPPYIPPKEFELKGDSKELINELIEKAPIKVVEGGNQAFYMPREDYIQMPPISQFEQKDDFYTTLLHEIGHWTMTNERVPRTDVALNKDNKPLSAKERYAAEELVAELFSVTAAPFFNVKYKPINSAQYLKSWLGALQNDQKFIYRAASYAEQATEFCLKTIGLDKAQKVTPQIYPVKFHVNDLTFPFYSKTKLEMSPFIDDLLAGRKSELIKGLQKGDGKPFDAQMKLSKKDDKILVKFFFPKKTKTKSKSVSR